MCGLAALVLSLVFCAFARPASPAEQAFARALGAMQGRDLSTARAAIFECLKLSPDYPGARPLAGEIESQVGLDLASRGRFAESLDHFRTVTELQPDFPGGHYNLGLALLNLGDAVGAERSFRRVLKLDPKNAKARAQIANALLVQARMDRARMAEAAEAFRQAIRISPNIPELHFNLAYALAALTDDAGALAEYREVSRLDPRYPDLEPSVGYTLYRLSEWAEAETHFRAALARGHDDYALHFYLGSTLVKTGHAAEALEHLEKAARLDPEQPGPHFQLAALYRAGRDNDRAVEELTLFRDLSARQETKWRNDALLEAAQRALGRGDLARGRNALAQAFQNRPDAVTARNLALAHLQTGDLAQARFWLERSLALAPKDATTYNYMGLLEAREGNLALAAGHFDTAVRLDPSQVEAGYNAGVTAFELGRTDAAIRYLEESLKRSDERRLHEALAVALSGAGRHEEARKHFEKAQPRP